VSFYISITQRNVWGSGGAVSSSLHLGTLEVSVHTLSVTVLSGTKPLGHIRPLVNDILT
jgi:hypothetical protein